MSDGRVLLLDGRERRLHVLASTGKPLREIGRIGAGPGEFQEPLGLVAMPGDSTVVIDRGLQRVQYIAGNLTFGRTALFPEMSEMGPNKLTRADSRGRLIFATFFHAQTTPRSAVVRWVPGSRRVDTLATLLYPPMTRPVRVADTLIVRYALPYRVEDGWALLQDDRIVTIRANPYGVETRASDGTLTRVSIRAPQVPVAASERSNFIPAVRDSMPRYKPPFVASSIVSGTDGSVWIPRYRAQDAKIRVWDVVAPANGRHVTRTTSRDQDVLAVTRSGVYIAQKGPDDLYRLEFHAHSSH
ncbi:MAG: hypothetical protein IBJ03_00830 [Gemmatimonadaceae bacterium]|nr:hypothetical protein [Gemmatimonadaceae bacterium]